MNLVYLLVLIVIIQAYGFHNQSHKLRRIRMDIAGLQTAVEAQNTVVASAEALLIQLSDAIKAAGTDPDKLQAIVDEINANTVGLSNAVIANTPSSKPVDPATVEVGTEPVNPEPEVQA